MYEMKPLVRVVKVKPASEFHCFVTFENGTRRKINLKPYLIGSIFEPIRNDPAIFQSMQVVDGTISWDNGADIDPDVLYYGLTPAWMEESVSK